MLCRWAQELLGHQFTIVHRSNKMMVDADALTWSFGNLISNSIAISALLSPHDQFKRPRAYAATKFSDLGNVKITETDNPSSDPPPFLTSDVLCQFSQDSTNNSTTAYSLETYSLTSITKLPIHMRPSPNLCTISPLHYSVTPNTVMSALYIPQSLEIVYLCINDVVGS